MRLLLTRRVLRHLLVHQSTPPCTILLARPLLCSFPAVHGVNKVASRRTFLGLFSKPPRIPKPILVEPGYDMLSKYWHHKEEQLRLPMYKEVLDAFRTFFKYKKLSRRPVTRTQAQIAIAVLKHLIEEQPQPPKLYDLQAKGEVLDLGDLRTARDGLMVEPRETSTDVHIEFAKALYEEIRRMSRISNRRTSQPGLEKPEDMEHAMDLAGLVRTLTRLGSSTEAVTYVAGFWGNGRKVGDGRAKALWFPLIRGLAKENKEAELLNTIRKMRKLTGLGYSQTIHGIMTTFYAQKDDFEQMKAWFSRQIVPEAPPSYEAYSEALQCAVRNEQRPWAMSLYEGIVNSVDSLQGVHYRRDNLLLVYQWAVLLHDKGAEHIERMMASYSDRYPDDPQAQPSVQTINGLIEAALAKGDAYLAERLVSILPALGMQADKQTHRLQIEYRLRVKDLDGAFSAYRVLQNMEVDNEDWPTLNRLIRGLCDVPLPNLDRILDVTSCLEENLTTPEAETVVSLCMTFLRNEEHFEVLDTLSLHSNLFGGAERQMIAKAFVEYCLDKSLSTARVWDAHSLLRQFFPDLEIQERLKLMDMFFDRKRADMATHVFRHMRESKDPRFRPDLDTYVHCLVGFGRCPDLEGLHIVHNFLKMDTTITPNTKLYNALMIAYTACDEGDRALDFWTEISRSNEGPTYNSLEITLRAHEGTFRGNEMARALWRKIQRMDIDVPYKVHMAYAAALAAHADVEEAKKVLVSMEGVCDHGPDPMALAAVYNALRSNVLKQRFEVWAKEQFPPEWHKLEKKKRIRDSYGRRVFRLSRPWTA